MRYIGFLPRGMEKESLGKNLCSNLPGPQDLFHPKDIYRNTLGVYILHRLHRPRQMKIFLKSMPQSNRTDESAQAKDSTRK